MLLAYFPGTDLGFPNLSLCFIPALAMFSIKMKKKNKFEQEKKSSEAVSSSAATLGEFSVVCLCLLLYFS